MRLTGNTTAGVKVGEVKAATRERRECSGAYGRFTADVWAFRGREWRLLTCTDGVTVVAVTHRPEMDDETLYLRRAARESVTLTPGAAKWVLAMWERETG